MNIMDMLEKLGYVPWFPTTRLTARAVELYADDTDSNSVWSRLGDEEQMPMENLMWCIKVHFAKQYIKCHGYSPLWNKVISHLRTKSVGTSTPTEIILALYHTYKEVKDEN